jgi:hypothetical protein
MKKPQPPHRTTRKNEEPAAAPPARSHARASHASQAEPTQPRIVSAVGVAVSKKPGAMGKAIEAAQSQAILDAAKQGIGADQPEKLRPLMAAAREKVIAEYRAAEASAAKE